jgi:hypothetical protein
MTALARLGGEPNADSNRAKVEAAPVAMSRAGSGEACERLKRRGGRGERGGRSGRLEDPLETAW